MPVGTRLSMACGILGACLGFALAPVGRGEEPASLETNADGTMTIRNEYVELSASSAQGGAVTSMRYRNAVSFPLIADRGAGIAGTGRFFTGVIAVGGKTLAIRDTELRPEIVHGGPDEVAVRFSGEVPTVARGFRVQRLLSLTKGESGFRLQDTFTNGGAAALKVRVGAEALQQPESWRLALRTWLGDRQSWQWLFTPYNKGVDKTWQARSPDLVWRVSGQYGVGFGYYVTAPKMPVELTTRFAKDAGNPAEMRWLSAEVDLPAGQSIGVESSVLIDEGARGEEPYPATDRVLVRGDLRRAGRIGEPMIGFGSVVSPVARKVKMILSQRGHTWKEGADKESEKLAEFDLMLQPGKWQFRNVEAVPRKEGLFFLEVEILDAAGKRIASGAAPRSLINGENATGEFAAVWKLYERKLPEVRLSGTWEQIGEQLAAGGKIQRAKTPSAKAAEKLKFYERRFPYYARLLQGAAKKLNQPAEQLVACADAPPAEVPVACMGVLLNGPDGPINAYSKERSGSSVSGMGYLKVLPDAGYPFHMYTLGGWSFGYGINSEGLCTSGATINCDRQTDTAGAAKTKEWAADGKHTAPIGTLMMLAMCKDVDEALAFIDNPEAPFDFTGNMLLVDRKGRAAVLESVGILHSIRRYSGAGVISATNYSHEIDGGLFKPGPNWGWHANGLFREKFIGDLMESLQNQVGLKDALWIMETHCLPGGMCQHVFENPGGLYSTCSYLAVARTGELFISDGPPCTVRCERYTLEPEAADKR